MAIPELKQLYEQAARAELGWKAEDVLNWKQQQLVEWLAAVRFQQELSNACPDCLGSGGEWIDRKDPRNSTYCTDNDEDEFEPCSRCHGTGSK